MLIGINNNWKKNNKKNCANSRKNSNFFPIFVTNLRVKNRKSTTGGFKEEMINNDEQIKGFKSFRNTPLSP